MLIPNSVEGVASSAALIMVAVFSIFLTLPLIGLKILGIGMGAGPSRSQSAGC